MPRVPATPLFVRWTSFPNNVMNDMKRLATTLLLSLFFLTLLHAGPVDRERAARTAVTWMQAYGGGEHTALSAHELHPFVRDGVTAYYIVNLAPDGFAIVSGDDIAWPVLMYGAEGRYDGSFLPPAVAGMLENFTTDLLADIAGGLPATSAATAMWKQLDAGASWSGFSKGGGNSISSVSPLVSATWNQTNPYNQDCPATSTGGSGGHVVTGCVATAMAMVMHFWGHPATGVGSHSYSHPTYGTLSANFGNTTYSWSSMPNSINTNSSTAAKAAIAQLSYHCGVSVEMDYAPSGSGASTADARDALVNHFRYKTTAQYRSRGSYTTSTWTSLLTGELDNGRPVMYRGSLQNGSNGHAFIVDGYTGSDYFHMNFGWGGYLNGYFYLNDITPGSNDFTYWQAMITGIEPLASTPPTLATPANQSQGVCVTPTLTWNAVSGASSYRLQVSTTSAFTSTVYDNAAITTTSATITGLSRGTTYYWRANATSSSLTSNWSPVWSFTTRNVVVSASGPTVFCEGGSVTLNGSTSAGGSLQWLKNGSPLMGGTQSSYVATESGSYVLAVTDNGCTTESDPLTVTVTPLPVAQISVQGGSNICQGQSVTLDADYVAGASYQWKKNGTDIGGAVGGSFSVTEDGSYTVEVSVSGCSSISLPAIIVVHPSDPDSFVWTGGISNDWGTTGNWDSPCALPGSGDDVTIPSGVTPPASIPTMSLGNLTIDNAAGVSLGGTVLVAGTLALQNGNLSLGDHDLVIEAGGSLVGAGAARRIVTNGSGMLRRLGLGSNGISGPVLFPVSADGNSYTPVTITNAATDNSYAVRVSDGVFSDGSGGTPVSSGVVDRTWFIAEGSGQSNVTLQFAWTTGEELTGFDRASCFVSRNDLGSGWTGLQQPAAAQGSGLITRYISGITGIGSLEVPFAIGSGGTLFPVEFLSFGAAVEDGHAILQWTTVNEVNNYGFRIEKREAGALRWSNAGFVPAGDAASERHSYAWRDAASLAAPTEYRLAQIDLDGGISHSGVLSVNAAIATALTLDAVYPQPLSAGANASVLLRNAEATEVRLALYDALGRQRQVLFEGALPAGSSRVITVHTTGLRAGVYFLHAQGGPVPHTRRFVITE